MAEMVDISVILTDMLDEHDELKRKAGGWLRGVYAGLCYMEEHDNVNARGARVLRYLRRRYAGKLVFPQ